MENGHIRMDRTRDVARACKFTRDTAHGGSHMPMTPIQYLLTPFYGGYQLYFIPTLTASIAALAWGQSQIAGGGMLA
jgi:hypothetical protein